MTKVKIPAGKINPCGDFYYSSKDFQGLWWNIFLIIIDFKSKIKGKDQESIQSSTITDPEYQWESNKLIIRHHKREPRGQPFPSR